MPKTQKKIITKALGPKGMVVKNSCLTKIKVDKLHYVWTIENYHFHHKKKEDIETPIFTAASNKEFNWFLWHKKDTFADNDDERGIFLCLDESSNCKKVFVKYKFSILDKILNERHTRTLGVKEFKSGGNCWGFADYITKDILSNAELFPNDKLTIYCEATFSKVKSFVEVLDQSNSIHLQPDVPDYSVSKDFGSLLDNEVFSDVTLSVNGKDYKAHKTILAARSPVFTAMFKHDMKENKNNHVEITDIDEKVIQEMLRYIYTGKAENSENLANGLLAAADKYGLEGLKIMCQEVLVKNLSIENAACTLTLAHLHCAHKLKSEIINFIVANSNEVMNSATWKSISPSYPQSLLLEVCSALSRQLAVSNN